VSVYIKNIDSAALIFRGRETQPDAYFEIPEIERAVWANDPSIFDFIANDQAMICKDDSGNNDISDKVKQWSYLGNTIPPTISLSSQTDSGLNKIAIVKPDNGDKTYVSPNYCDNTSWTATNDSAWSLTPSAGKVMTVTKTEVQFTHDVKLKTLTIPGEIYFDLCVNGTPIASESKTIKSLSDVFDLGNKHYSMDATVDGIPGMTTVVFDYTSVIKLYSSMAMSIRISTKDDLELGGTHCSVSIIGDEHDE